VLYSKKKEKNYIMKTSEQSIMYEPILYCIC